MSWIIWVLIGMIGLIIIAVVVKKLKHKDDDDDIFSKASGISKTWDACCRMIGKFFGGGA